MMSINIREQCAILVCGLTILSRGSIIITVTNKSSENQCRYKSLFSILQLPSFRRLFPPEKHKILEIHKVFPRILHFAGRKTRSKIRQSPNTKQALRACLVSSNHHLFGIFSRRKSTKFLKYAKYFREFCTLPAEKSAQKSDDLRY